MTNMNSKKIRILVLGAGGLLGSELVPFLMRNGHEIITHGRTSGDYKFSLDDLNTTKKNLDCIEPDVIINLVGLTDVDRCEVDPNQAYLDNVRTVENIATCINSSSYKCHLVHISTDQVYDGQGEQEEQDVKLKNYYAFSKYAGELAAISTKGTVLRTNFFGRSKCKTRISLSDWLYNALTRQDKIQVFNDVHFSPLSMGSLSKLIEFSAVNKLTGIFNLGSHGGLSKADFAFAFAHEFNLPVNSMTRIETDKVTFLKTYRPKDMRMNCSKFETLTSIQLPSLIDEIKTVAKDYL